MRKPLKKYCLIYSLLALSVVAGLFVLPTTNLLPENIAYMSLTRRSVDGYGSNSPTEELLLPPEEQQRIIKLLSSAILIKDPFLSPARPTVLGSDYYIIGINEWEKDSFIFSLYADGTITIWIRNKTINCRALYPIGTTLYRSIAGK